MTAPHLSGLEFLGHNVTVGNITSFIEITTVFEAIGCVYHATKRNTLGVSPNFRSQWRAVWPKVSLVFEDFKFRFSEG